MATPTKTNYLNNRDILKEIHLSKKTYCSYLDPNQDHQFDIIVSHVHKINMRTIAEARRNRAARITRESGQEVSEKKIPNTDLVFRVMTWEHIPMAPKKPRKTATKKKKIEDILALDDVEEVPEVDIIVDTGMQDPTHVRVNFPPFFHYRIDENKKPYLVGKSHWRGDLDYGEFSKDHGEMTRKLAMMFMKLCERYATRSNWRGYCVDEATEALTQRGWLGINEINENDTILSYSYEQNRLAWSSIKSIYRGNHNGPMHYITHTSIDSLITPEHKIVTSRGLVKIEHLKQSDRVIVMGDETAAPVEQTHSDAFVELIGWVVTEGCYEIDANDNIKRIVVYQNSRPNANRIRNCLTALDFHFTESTTKNIAFAISRADSRKIYEYFPDKNLTMDFILSLTADQRQLLINTMIDGDGWRRGNNMSYTQKDKKHIDLFQALLSIAGLKSNYHYVQNHMSFGKPVDFYNIHVFSQRRNSTKGESLNLNGGLNNGAGQNRNLGKESFPNRPTVEYTGPVWCPETEYGSFLARRNGKVYLTGNTYNEEMRGQALLQLSQIGLQFDESKSSNPFAYYTAAITNSFTRVLNIEKKNQNIRDDILEINGLNPSWTRQNAGKGGAYMSGPVTTPSDEL